MKKISSLHHIIPISRGGQTQRDKNSMNIKVLKEKTHHNLHAAFGSANPHEQIINVLNSDCTILYTKQQSILEILSDIESKDIYIPEVITDLNKFNDIHSRSPEVLKEWKKEKFYNALFGNTNKGECKILKLLDISSTALRNDIKEKILNIIQ